MMCYVIKIYRLLDEFNVWHAISKTTSPYDRQRSRDVYNNLYILYYYIDARNAYTWNYDITIINLIYYSRHSSANRAECIIKGIRVKTGPTRGHNLIMI